MRTIVYFEWIIFGTLLLSALQSYLGWDRAIVQAAPSHRDLAVAIIIMLIFEFVLPGTLTLLVSRRRSKIAMWVLIAWFALGLVSTDDITRFLFSTVLRLRLETTDIIAVALLIGQVVAVGLLFTPSARRWMRREDERLTYPARST